eukprot:CAMPEP_0113937780 /NCGR_PEP_ID=MMETSP1339-20121228/4326_1 /TAXON_ID=94617 /ORGANISM="Fibrocapsa japonica" /LENGTH=585 /DNA_ID=CAMNT_0000940679 /DNA_START=147 /DNA_END=1904 /DNA_ORIENTATION=- /assembly_acc=CAM_ASM_000762
MDKDKKKENASPWLNAWHDPVVGLKAFTSCVRLADLNGDGDYKLVVADRDKRLRIYKGTSTMAEQDLLDAPVAVAHFYTDNNLPRTPAVAVATGPYVFIYRNLRPYFKFTVPPLDIDPVESGIWNELKNQRVDVPSAVDLLSSARDNGTRLSARSMDLLAIEDEAQRTEYVQAQKNLPHIQQTVVTCMETIKKNSEEDDAVSSLVLGTESKQVLLLDPPGNNIVTGVTLQGIPSMLAVTGLFDVEWRIVAACRDGKIYTIKAGDVRSKTAIVTGTVIEVETQPVALCRLDKMIYVATMDQHIHCFLLKGKKNFSMSLAPQNITNMEVLAVKKARVVSALLVALDNGEVRLYREKHLVHVLKLDDVVTAMRFGQYGREESTLALLTRSGSLTIKMLQRKANLESSSINPGPPPEQDIPLNVPKKTKLYVEMTQREREQAVDMHRMFQRDLCKLRLHTARTYVKIITEGQMGISPVGGASIRLNAQVQGLGPHFKIKVQLQNGGTRSLMKIPLTFVFNRSLYLMRQSQMVLPVLLPGLMCHYEAEIESIDENGTPDVVKILVLNPSSTVPLVSGIVNMPRSELLELT